jgi:hypothetical protein
MKRAALWLACIAATWSATAHADTLRSFAVLGLFRDNAVMSGTLTIDKDTGTSTACDIKVSGQETLTFQRVVKQTTVGMAAVVVLTPAHKKWPRLVFGEQTFPGSLRGYNGGPLGQRTDIVHSNQSKQLILSGHLIAMPAQSSGGPEPS